MTKNTGLWTAHTSCPHCDDGVLWRNERTRERVCDSCHAALAPVDRSATLKLRDPYDRQYEPRGEGGGERDQRRLVGGWQHAYYSWVTDKEYALDTYGEVTDGLWTPRDRDWSRGDATADD